jgi:hypothetical protein
MRGNTKQIIPGFVIIAGLLAIIVKVFFHQPLSHSAEWHVIQGCLQAAGFGLTSTHTRRHRK